MQKQFLAAVVASVVAGQAMAVTVFENDNTKFAIGGHIGVRGEAGKSGDDTSNLKAAGDSSRFNFQMETKLTEDITAFGRGEWGFDVTRHDREQFNNRLGFVGVRHADFGSISAGQQWSSFSQVANWTDTFATADGGLGMYNAQGGFLGTSRANEALQYNISVEGLNISAQYQPGNSFTTEKDEDGNTVITDARTRKHGYQFAASYDLPMGVSAGITYNQVQFVQNNEDDAKALVVAVKYEEGPVYSAFSYGDYKNTATLANTTLAGGATRIERARGIEIVGGYQLADNWSVQTGFMQLKDKNNSNMKDQNVPVEVVYTAGPMQLSGNIHFRTVSALRRQASSGSLRSSGSLLLLIYLTIVKYIPLEKPALCGFFLVYNL